MKDGGFFGVLGVRFRCPMEWGQGEELGRFMRVVPCEMESTTWGQKAQEIPAEILEVVWKCTRADRENGRGMIARGTSFRAIMGEFIGPLIRWTVAENDPCRFQCASQA